MHIWISSTQTQDWRLKALQGAIRGSILVSPDAIVPKLFDGDVIPDPHDEFRAGLTPDRNHQGLTENSGMAPALAFVDPSSCALITKPAGICRVATTAVFGTKLSGCGHIILKVGQGEE